MDDPPPLSEEETKRQAEIRAERWQKLRQESRMSLPFGLRLPIASTVSFLVGASMGISQGSMAAGLRFRAENAHRLPSTPTGWYLYHKSKNYVMAFGGLKEGLRMGGKVAFWTAAFFAVEDVGDRWRGTKDFVNTVIASLAVSGGFSLWNRLPITTAARTAKSALAIGLAFGLAQDAVGAMKGRRPGYVEFMSRRGQRKADKAIKQYDA